MIRLADKFVLPEIRRMWKRCFGDSEEFMNLYFTRKYEHLNTLIYIEEESIVASLQMLPYAMRFYGSVIPLSYISGACTLPEYREKGYMRKLLETSFRIMQQRDIPVSVLIPAEEWLYGYYSRLGYEKTFDKGTEELNLEPLVNCYLRDKNWAYSDFTDNFQQNDFCILKTQEDFDTIIQEYLMDQYTPKYNLSGMTRVIDALYLLNLYAKQNTGKSFTIKITDEIIIENNTTFLVENGAAYAIDTTRADMEVDIRLLARLLMGYQTNSFPPHYKSLFEEHTPIMNLMLE